MSVAGPLKAAIIRPPSLSFIRLWPSYAASTWGPGTLLGAVQVVPDPDQPKWARETVFEAGAKMAQYYEQAYGRPLKEPLSMLMAAVGYESKGLSMNDGALLGQVAYRFEGQQMLGDHPKKARDADPPRPT